MPHWLGVKASDKIVPAEEISEYIHKTEADHDRAAMIFGLVAMTVPFMIVGVLVSVWLLLF
jgi:hypothetical protein